MPELCTKNLCTGDPPYSTVNRLERYWLVTVPNKAKAKKKKGGGWGGWASWTTQHASRRMRLWNASADGAETSCWVRLFQSESLTVRGRKA